MFKIFHHSPDGGAVGLYRVKQPVKFCAPQLLKDNIELTTNSYFGLEHDAFIFHGIPKPHFLPALNDIMKANKKFIVSLDDDVYNVQDWNPAKPSYTDEALVTLDWMLSKCHAVVVSTDYLEYAIKEKTKSPIYVLSNLIDASLWNKHERDIPNERVRIVWPGSVNHSGDLLEIVDAVETLIEEYDEKIQFLFWGDLPEEFSEYVRIRGSNLAAFVPKAKYRNKVGLIEMVPLDDYPQTFIDIQPDICIAPLEESTFNLSKSHIKWLESTLAGGAFVCSNLPPYRFTTGLRVNPGHRQTWVTHLRELIESPKLRDDLVKKSTARVMRWNTWQNATGMLPDGTTLGGVNRWLDFYRGLAS